jgi:hypothetical protein
VSRWRFFHVDSSKELLGREREDQVVQQCESYLTQMRKGSNDAHQVTARESEILDLLRLGHPLEASNLHPAGSVHGRLSQDLNKLPLT